MLGSLTHPCPSRREVLRAAAAAALAACSLPGCKILLPEKDRGPQLPLGTVELDNMARQFETLSTQQLSIFSRAVPKVDLHCHLEGALTPDMMIRIARRHGIELPSYDPEILSSFLQVDRNDPNPSLLKFLKGFEHIGKIFTDSETIIDITEMVVSVAALDRVSYLELRFSPLYMAAAHSLDPEMVTQSVIEGRRRAMEKYHPINVNLIAIVERQKPLEAAWVVERLAEKYASQGIVALDLANDEYHYPPGPFAPVFQAAKRAGLKVTVHAGEAAGPENIRVAIEQLGADRIGHGVRAGEDADVVRLLVERGIPLEMAATSNIDTGAVPSLSKHPLRDYLHRGVHVTINTDDPGVSGIRLSSELQTLVTKVGLNFHDLYAILCGNIGAAFLPQDQKLELRAQLDQYLRTRLGS